MDEPALKSNNLSRKQLRRTLRERRRALSGMQQLSASQGLMRQLRKHPLFLRSKRIAGYMAGDGEIDPGPILDAAENMGKEIFLPILHPLRRGELLFGAYTRETDLFINHYGLTEPPMDGYNIPAWSLDCVIMPLVGFDNYGNRLGMGGGFYDKTFAFIKNKTRPRYPVLIAVAHSCQQVDKLKQEKWDVTPDYIVTEEKIVWSGNG